MCTYSKCRCKYAHEQAMDENICVRAGMWIFTEACVGICIKSLSKLSNVN